MAKDHHLKCWTKNFEDHRRGLKMFDVRRDDRGFNEGDMVTLEEFRHAVGEFTGRKLQRTISFILRPSGGGESNGIRPGYCVLGYKGTIT